ncbi:MAG: DUF4397 domain-containing protein [Chloroflexi bacterium]|nr:DUF4397 domain-containing protein [Chloroflexota bacterium]
MKIRLIRIVLFILYPALLLAAAPSLAQESARARFVNVAPGTPSLDIYVNGELVESGLSYGESSAYLNVPSGNIGLKGLVSGTSVVQLGHNADIAAGSAVSYLISSAVSPRFRAIPENLGALEFGATRLSIVYAIDDGSPVDIVFRENGEILGADIRPGTLIGPYELRADVYDLDLVVAGDASGASILDLRMPVSAGTSQLAIIYGAANDPQVLTTATPTALTTDSGLVRFLHAVQGATPFALSVDGSPIVPSLAYAMPSEHIALPSGSHRVALSIGGAEITSMTLNVAAGQAQTAVVMGSPANLSMSSYNDDLSGIDRTSALVSLINAIPGSTVERLALSSGATAAMDVAYGSASDAAKIVTGKQGLSLDLTIGDDSGTVNLPASRFNGGSYYNLIALPGSAFSGPQLLIAETSILRGLDLEVMMMGQERATEAPSTEAPSAEQAVEEEEVRQPVVVTAAEIDGPTARVNLNRGVNLHLRQYPDSGSLSLGLAPSGTTLIVLGRRGLTEYYGAEPADEPVDLSDFDADPAEGLERWQDLESAETWLFVTYMTPDGGTIDAWVNALYLGVEDEDGEPQRLADLEMIRQNQAGLSRATSIGPPQPLERVSAYAFNLNAGVNLNIRMANDVSSENLGQVANGDPLRLIGLDEADEWAYIEYDATDSVVISGWVSLQYVQILLDGRPTSPEALREFDASLISVVSDSARGGINLAGEAEAPAAPTRDPLLGAVVATVALNPDANLHLRLRPNANSESLDLIPSRTSVIADGVTESEEWYRVSYEGVPGWISAAYTVLSFNDRYMPIEEILGRLTLFDDLGNEMPEEEMDEMSDQ